MEHRTHIHPKYLPRLPQPPRTRRFHLALESGSPHEARHWPTVAHYGPEEGQAARFEGTARIGRTEKLQQRRRERDRCCGGHGVQSQT